MVTMSSRCRDAAESSQSPAKRRMRCALSSVPFKMHQLRTQTVRAGTLRRRFLGRRRHHPAQGLRRLTSSEAPLQDLRPCKGRLPPSHRKARPAPSSGKARWLSPGGPQTLPRSRGRRSGTTRRRASRHVSLKKAWGKEGPTPRSSSPRPLRSFKNQERFCLPGITPHPGEDGGLRVCIDYPGLN